MLSFFDERIASYEMDSFAPIPYFYLDVPKLPAITVKDAKAPVCSFISNCRGERMKYVEELMKYIEIDNYGDCLHNKEIDDSLKDLSDYDGKTSIETGTNFLFKPKLELLLTINLR